MDIQKGYRESQEVSQDQDHHQQHVPTVEHNQAYRWVGPSNQVKVAEQSAFQINRKTTCSLGSLSERLPARKLMLHPWLMYQSNQSLNISPRAYPGHLTSFPAREGGNLINLVFPGAGHLITTHRGWGI